MFEDPTVLALSPVHFFALSFDCHQLPTPETIPAKRTHSLPSTHHLCHEFPFAHVTMGWHEEGIGLEVEVNQLFTKACYPEVSRGDSIELFIDTRDLKSAGFNTRFCHHFFFLPQAVDDQLCGEITRFRTEDDHPLCDSQALKCQTHFNRKGYVMNIFIPVSCLYGYDPKQFDRLGFNYRINRATGAAQHFSVVSSEYQVDQQPSLWASVNLQTKSP